MAATNRRLEDAVADGDVPGGPLLPAQRLSDPPAAAARAAGGPAGAGGASGRAGPAAPGAGRSRPRRSRRWPAYAWPGNVRELANLVERLSILSGPTVDGAAVRAGAPRRRPAAAAAPSALGRPLSEALDDFERGLIARRARAGAGQHRRSGAGAADRPRQPLPPDAAAGSRHGRSPAAPPIHVELRMRLLRRRPRSLLLALPAAPGAGQRHRHRSRPAARRLRRGARRARRPTSWPS